MTTRDGTQERRYTVMVGRSFLPHTYARKENALAEGRRVAELLIEAGVDPPIAIRYSTFDPYSYAIGSNVAPYPSPVDAGEELYHVQSCPTAPKGKS